MPLISVYFTFSLYILSELEAVWCYTYQTEPLFLSFSELAALEAANSRHGTSEAHEPPRGGPGDAAGTAATFAVKCHEGGVEVVLRAYLLDPALPVEPAHLRLGPAGASPGRCTARDSGRGEYLIRASLTDCGGRVTFTESSMLYDNLLLYTPPATSPMRGGVIPVHCEYKRLLSPSRRYTVSSRVLKSTWSPRISVHAAHLKLDFRLRLMTNDWSSARKSPVYFLGEMVNIEASVDQRPLRLHAARCVATLTSDVNSNPRYPFIDHQGCFTDSQLNGSGSRFLPRVQDSLLQIQLEPFLFLHDHRNTIYITCDLEAELASSKDPEKKACSFMSGRWKSVDGNDDMCESCSKNQETKNHSDEPGHKRALRGIRKYSLNELQRETMVGPIIFLPWKAEHSENHKHLY